MLNYIIHFVFGTILVVKGSFLQQELRPVVVHLNSTEVKSSEIGDKLIRFPTGEQWACGNMEVGERRFSRDDDKSVLRKVLEGKCMNFGSEILGDLETHVFCSGGTATKRNTKGLTSFGRSLRWISDSEEFFGFSDDSGYSAIVKYVCNGASEFTYLHNKTFHYTIQHNFVCNSITISEVLENFKCAEFSDHLWQYRVCQTQGMWNITQTKVDEQFVLGEGSKAETKLVTDGVSLDILRMSTFNRNWLPAPAHVQVLVPHGSLCAATGSRRNVRIWFQCAVEELKNPKIEIVIEPIVCEYLIVINTNDVCVFEDLRWKKIDLPEYHKLTCNLIN